MPTAKNIRCTICTKDGPLREYRGDKAQPSLLPSCTTVYTQVEDATTFWIECETLPGYQYTIGDSLSFQVYLDGKYASSAMLNKDTPNAKVEGVSSKFFVKPFKFSEISLVEDDGAEGRLDRKSLAKVGEISIHVLRAQVLRDYKSTPKRGGGLLKFDQDSSLSERELKGRDLTYITNVGRRERREKAESFRYVKTKRFDKTTDPYVHFQILYRSKRALKSLGLIQTPRTPLLPVAEPRASDLRPSQEPLGSGLSKKVILKEVERLKAQANYLESYLKVKQVAREDTPEAENSRVKRRKLSNGDARKKSETVDLT